MKPGGLGVAWVFTQFEIRPLGVIGFLGSFKHHSVAPLFPGLAPLRN